MYSRYHNHSATPIQIPENYSGSAFSDRRPPEVEEKKNDPPLRIDVAKPTPVEKSQAPGMAPPKPILLPPPREEAEKRPPSASESPAHDEKDRLTLPPTLQSLFGAREHTFPFSHGIGFDELLILGLILVLSRSGQENDLILWLVLLLFCG